MIVDIIKIIMSENKITLSFLKNHDWKTVKSEIEKVKNLFTNNSTKDITELNDLTYTEAKLE